MQESTQNTSLLGRKKSVFEMQEPKSSMLPASKPAKIEEAVQNIEKIQEKIDEQVDAKLESLGLPTREQNERLAEEEIARLRTDGTYDIFSHMERDYASHQIDVLYRIYSGNTLVGEENHPYEFGKLQEDYGSGKFTVKAFTDIDKKYISQQTITISMSRRQKNGLTQTNPVFSEPPKAKDPLEDLLKLATVMKALNPVAPQKDNSTEFTKLLLEMQKSTQDTLKEMNKNTNDMMKEMLREIKDVQKDTASKFEKLADAKAPKEAFSPMEMFKMLNQVKDDGFEKWKMLEEMAEEKAEKLAELNEDRPKETMIEKLATSLGPILAQVLVAQQNKPALPAPQPQMRQVAPPQAPRPNNFTPSAPNQNVARKGPPQSSGVKPMQKAPIKPATPAAAVVVDPKLQETVVNIIIPILMQNYIAETPMPEIAELTIKGLSDQNLTLEQGLKAVTRNDMMNIARHNNLPPQMDDLLNDYYNHLEARLKGENVKIQTTAGVDAR